MPWDYDQIRFWAGNQNAEETALQFLSDTQIAGIAALRYDTAPATPTNRQAMEVAYDVCSFLGSSQDIPMDERQRFWARRDWLYQQLVRVDGDPRGLPLALRGPQGEQGIRGLRGLRGPEGPQGPPGQGGGGSSALQYWQQVPAGVQLADTYSDEALTGNPVLPGDARDRANFTRMPLTEKFTSNGHILPDRPFETIPEGSIHFAQRRGGNYNAEELSLELAVTHHFSEVTNRPAGAPTADRTDFRLVYLEPRPNEIYTVPLSIFQSVVVLPSSIWSVTNFLVPISIDLRLRGYIFFNNVLQRTGAQIFGVTATDAAFSFRQFQNTIPAPITS